MITKIALALLSISPQVSEWYTIPGSDHWYSLTSGRLSWPAAESEAQALGGHLAALTDEEENDWAFAQFGGSEELWIGLTDVGTRGEWTWSSGEAFDFNAWAPGEPNNLFGLEDFVVLTGQRDGVWEDVFTTSTHRGIIEVVSIDCDGDLIPDSVELLTGGAEDCDGNGIIDECDPDCDENGIPDACREVLTDCNGNGVPDGCDIADGTSLDCNNNQIPDECDVTGDVETDCDRNGVPDSCDLDCDENGTPDACDIADGAHTDCNGNEIPDTCDIASGLSQDVDTDGVPDECQPDCNRNGVPDSTDISSRASIDCDSNGIPDECENDCNANGIGDQCEIDSSPREDCNENGILDECELSGRGADLNQNGVLDECECRSSTYCDGASNSVGEGAVLSLNGLPSVSQPGSLRVSQLPQGAPVVYFYGTKPFELPFGAGVRCVSYPVKRLHPAQVAGRDGATELQLDFSAPPLFGEVRGSTLFVQAWYIDSGEERTANMSNAIQITLCE
ncbi:MAG: hypothetical protein MK297_07385 [Planctomycetes bacterium]|nr:hypothetical protein [Planctomycetota bacterium]